VLKVGNDFGHGGLRDTELDRRLRHAAALHYREEGMKISQSELPADLAFPIDPPGHMNPVMPIKEIQNSFYIHER
jgi:hypothetical protein